MIAISDTSPICHLPLIKKIDLLPIYFQKIIIPPQVLAELIHPHAPESVRSFCKYLPSWLEMRSPQHIIKLPRLGLGEEAAINLAKELKADLLLIDDKFGRDTAMKSPFSLNIIGTLGLLEKAASENRIQLCEVINQLLQPISTSAQNLYVKWSKIYNCFKKRLRLLFNFI